MESRDLVSVLTPTYEQASYLHECINSVVAQTRESWEQIIVDDGSTDATESVVTKYHDDRLRYVRQEHRGIWQLAATYNRALAEARGSLIAVLEGDDIWLPDLLENLLPAFADPGVVVSYGLAGVLRDRTPTRYRIPDDRFRRRFGRGVLFNDPIGSATYGMLHRAGLTFTFPCAVLIRRSALESIGGFQQIAGVGTVDYPTFVRLSLKGRFSFTPRLVSYWRRHAGSSSAQLYESTYEGISAFALGFACQHVGAPGLTRNQLRAIVFSWKSWPARLELHRGRALLIGKRWSEARQHFLRAMKTRTLAVVVGATLGYLASLLHRDIEPLVRASGRADLYWYETITRR